MSEYGLEAVAQDMTGLCTLSGGISVTTSLRQGALIRKGQFGRAVSMADCVPVLVYLHPADGAIATQHWWEWV